MSRSLILAYVSPTWGSFVTLSLILLVLYLRSTGLFGEWQTTTQGTR
jgi:hypothetical protein